MTVSRPGAKATFRSRSTPRRKTPRSSAPTASWRSAPRRRRPSAGRCGRRRAGGLPGGPEDQLPVTRLDLQASTDPGPVEDRLGKLDPPAAADHERRLAGAGLLCDPPIADPHRSVECCGRGRIVRHDDRRQAVCRSELGDRAANRPCGLGVQRCGRFIGQEQRWTVGDGHTQGEALALASGKLGRHRTRPVAQANRLQQLGGAPTALAGRGAAQRQRQLDRASRPEVGRQDRLGALRERIRSSGGAAGLAPGPAIGPCPGRPGRRGRPAAPAVR